MAAKHCKNLVKYEERKKKMAAKHRENMAKIEEMRGGNNENMRRTNQNKWNRQFHRLDKYGNAIHPRYRKNEKKL